MTIWDLHRNDIAACQRYHDEHGGVTPDEMSVMLHLQDDSDELGRTATAKGWKTRPER